MYSELPASHWSCQGPPAARNPVPPALRRDNVERFCRTGEVVIPTLDPDSCRHRIPARLGYGEVRGEVNTPNTTFDESKSNSRPPEDHPALPRLIRCVIPHQTSANPRRRPSAVSDRSDGDAYCGEQCLRRQKLVLRQVISTLTCARVERARPRIGPTAANAFSFGQFRQSER